MLVAIVVDVVETKRKTFSMVFTTPVLSISSDRNTLKHTHIHTTIVFILTIFYSYNMNGIRQQAKAYGGPLPTKVMTDQTNVYTKYQTQVL